MFKLILKIIQKKYIFAFETFWCKIKWKSCSISSKHLLIEYDKFLLIFINIYSVIKPSYELNGASL